MLAGAFGSCSHPVTPPPAPADAVTISGPKTGFDSVPYTFTASINFTSQNALLYKWVFADTTIFRSAVDSVTRSFPLKDTGRQIFSLHVIRTSDSTLLCSATDTISISDTTTHPPPNPNDTTSHNFVWTEYDNVNGENNMTGCWVFGPNDIYALNGNLHHFDGTSWTLATLNGHAPGALSGASMFGFTDNDFWIIDGEIMYHWNGSTVEETRLDNTGVWHYPHDGPIYGAWGTSSNDMYFVGDSGTILHFDGTNWTKMNSGTKIRLGSIFGTNDNNIWAGGYDLTTAAIILLHYDGSTWREDELTASGEALPYSAVSVWTCDSAGHQFVCTSGDVVFRKTDNGPWRMDSILNLTGVGNSGNHTLMEISGQSANDLMTGGEWGFAMHWNGKSWQRFDQFIDLSGTSARGLSIPSLRGNTVCLVGMKEANLSWILVGQRQ